MTGDDVLGLVGDTLFTTGRQLLTILGPLAILSILLHLVHRLLTGRLLERVGWKGVLITAWLGVPVHEFSHLLMCRVFGHRVEKVQLFAPDKTTGRLGVVQHAWKRGNLWQQIGRFFIGVAPLVGGSAVLWLITRLLLPGALSTPDLSATAGFTEFLGAVGATARSLGEALTADGALGRWQTWVYVYLCVCIGAHLAPSASDLRGGRAGFSVLLLLLLIANAVVLGVGGSAADAERVALDLSASLLGLLSLAFVLGAGSVVLVWSLTLPLSPRRP